MRNDTCESSETIDGITWNYTVNDGNATICGCKVASIADILTSATVKIVVPSCLGGCPVRCIVSDAFCPHRTINALSGETHVEKGAFFWYEGSTSLMIPDSVTSIGDYAFKECSGLTSVTIGIGVTSIENGVFSGCTGLKDVKIPASVTNIGACAFSGCRGLTSITIPDSVTSIGTSAFSGCRGLTGITMPAGMTSISRGAVDLFGGCEALTSITIPSSVTNIEPLGFGHLPSHVSFVVDIRNPKYKSVNGLVLTKDGKTLVLGSNGIVTIPDCVESIGNEAFCYCEGLASVILSEGVTCIGHLAFANCKRLASVSIPDSTNSIDDTAFSNCDSLMSIVVSGGNTVYSSANGLLLSHDGKTLLKGVNGDVVIPSGVTTIGGTAFCNRKGLRRVTIPDSVMNIEDGAFSGCSQLIKVEIRDDTANMRIGVNSFDGCDLLAEIPMAGRIFPGAPDDPVWKKWERKVQVLSQQCQALLKTVGRDNVKIVLRLAFSIIPDEWNISNAREACRYFRLFCNCLGLNSPTDNKQLTGVQVELDKGVALLFEFTCGKSSYSAFENRRSRGIGKYADWERVCLFGVNYNSSIRTIDAPYSASYTRCLVPACCQSLNATGPEYRLHCTDRDRYAKDIAGDRPYGAGH